MPEIINLKFNVLSKQLKVKLLESCPVVRQQEYIKLTLRVMELSSLVLYIYC
jgi:hypothetical protein